MKRSEVFITFLLVLFDYLAVLAAFLAAYFLRDYLNSTFIMAFSQFVKLAAVFSLLWLPVITLLRLYSRETEHTTMDEFLGVLSGSFVAVVLSATIIYLFKQVEFSRLVLGGTFVLAVLFIMLGRSLVKFLQNFLYAHGRGIRRVLLIGGGQGANLVVEGLRARGDRGYQVAGLVLLPGDPARKIPGARKLGQLADLDKILDQYRVDELIVTDSRLSGDGVDYLMRQCSKRSIRLKFVPDLFSGRVAKVSSWNLAGIPILEMQLSSLSGVFIFTKRMMDIIVAVVALIITAPILLITILAIKAFDRPGPAIFPHERVGRFGKKFYLYKFRSMRMYRIKGELVHAEEYLKVNRDLARKLEESPYYKIKDDPRISLVGRIIRKLSIDELPQFVNVLRGEMSVVGPRAYIEPELNRQRKVYPHTSALIDRLLLVKPGITGLWQVSGRSNIVFSERVAMDAYYATHASLALDIKIMLQTVPVVVKGSGAM